MSQIHDQKISDYIEKIEQEEIRKNRIQILTEQYLGQQKLKKKIYTNQGIKENNFNRKINQMKQLKTFFSAEKQIKDLNVLNDPEIMLKINSLKKKVQPEADLLINEPKKQNQQTQYQDPSIMFRSQSIILRKRNVKSDWGPAQEGPILGSQMGESKIIDSKDQSPDHIKRGSQDKEEIKNQLLKSGIMLKECSSTVECDYQGYYNKFRKNSEDIIKSVMKSSRNALPTDDSMKVFNIIKFKKKTQQSIRRKPSMMSSSNNLKKLFETDISVSPIKTTREIGQTERSKSRELKPKIKSHVIQNKQNIQLRSLFQQFKDKCSETERQFYLDNKANKFLIRQMSFVINQAQEKCNILKKNDLL